MPVTVTSLTTVVGFLSLALSDVIPVRQVGLLAALGILLAWIGNFMIVPVLLHRLWGEPRKDSTAGSASRGLGVVLGRAG